MKHKHYDYIVAWAEGKEIQVYRRDDGWINDNSPSWHFSEEYRIKPESTCPRCGKVHTCDPDKNWYNGSTASVNWVAGGGAGTGYKW